MRHRYPAKRVDLLKQDQKTRTQPDVKPSVSRAINRQHGQDEEMTRAHVSRILSISAASAGVVLLAACGAGGTISTAAADLKLVNVQNFDPAVCKPTDVTGLRVYLPQETAAKFLPAPGTGCASSAIPGDQLEVQTAHRA